MYNTKFTNSAIKDKHLISRKYKLVFDADGKVLCGINKKGLCDLNGKKIATFSCKETNKNNPNLKQFKYESEYGVFRLVGTSLFLHDARVGVVQRGINKSSVLMLCITCILLMLTFGIISVVDTPDMENPTIALEEPDGGVLNTEQEIAVFDPQISPDSKGDFGFNIENPNGRKLIYSFDIYEKYNGEAIDKFPMKYRIKMNNIYILNEDFWVESSKLSFDHLIIADRSTQEFTLEWYWPFDGGNDTLDTYFGSDGGEYSIVIKITAEFAE